MASIHLNDSLHAKTNTPFLKQSYKDFLILQFLPTNLFTNPIGATFLSQQTIS